MKKFAYQTGRKCSICGAHIDSSESYSIPRGSNKIICNSCDPDLKPQLTPEQEDLIINGKKEK